MEPEILLHLIELGLILLSLLWVALRDTKFIRWLPIRIIAVVTIAAAVLGMAALAVWDVAYMIYSIWNGTWF